MQVGVALFTRCSGIGRCLGGGGGGGGGGCIYNSFNPSPGRYFPLKYLFGTGLNFFLINHSHTVLLLHLCQCEAERWGDLKNIYLEMLY